MPRYGRGPRVLHWCWWRHSFNRNDENQEQASHRRTETRTRRNSSVHNRHVRYGLFVFWGTAHLLTHFIHSFFLTNLDPQFFTSLFIPFPFNFLVILLYIPFPLLPLAHSSSTSILLPFLFLTSHLFLPPLNPSTLSPSLSPTLALSLFLILYLLSFHPSTSLHKTLPGKIRLKPGCDALQSLESEVNGLLGKVRENCGKEALGEWMWCLLLIFVIADFLP